MSRGPKPFWTVDSETDPFETPEQSISRRSCPECGVRVGDRCRSDGGGIHNGRRRVPKPFIWGLYGGPRQDDYYEFETVDELINFLENQPHIVYAHNGGKFDYFYMRDRINTDESISLIAGRLARFRIGVCEFRDSMNILPVSLATFKKDDIDYSIMEADVRDLPHNREIIRKYLRNDCVYLRELIVAHRKENGVVLTQAGASMRSWAKESGIAPPRQSSARYQQYKPFYYGGRVECFASGIKSLDFQVIDKNSAYPEAMLYEHPYSTTATEQTHLPKDSEIHHCFITLLCVAYRCFPYRSDDGSLDFPCDEQLRRYHITGYEFIAALKANAIKTSTMVIETVYIFDEVVKFEEFIQSRWSRRRAAQEALNKALDIILKLDMNGLYGKFASDYNKYKEYKLRWLEDFIPVDEEGHDENGFLLDSNWSEGKILVARPIPEEKHRFYNIATAASITGFVRAKLFEAIINCNTPLYCDTDSIACVSTGSLVLGNTLGAWKHEGNFDRYAIVGKKTYSFHKCDHPYTDELDDKGNYKNYKVACKGVDLTPFEIEEAASGKVIVYSPTVPTYSVKREQPIFVERNVKLTARIAS